MESGSSTSNVANSGDAERATDPPARIPQNEKLTALPAVPPTPFALEAPLPRAVSTGRAAADVTMGTPMVSDSKSALTGIVPRTDPFGGFIGHSFLYFCRLVDRVAGSMKPRSVPAEVSAQSILSSPATSHVSHWGACSMGTICCTIAAACLIPVFYASTVKAFLPIPFLLIIVLVAFRFGRAAGVLGTIAAALLFALFLYEPPGLGVSDPAARTHLMWMLIIGIVISDLLTRFKMSRTGRHRF
jgi:hypothetical protein